MGPTVYGAISRVLRPVSAELEETGVKGIAVAVVAFFLSTIVNLTTVLHLTLAFMLYSIILSTVVLLFAKKILNVKVEQNV